MTFRVAGAFTIGIFWGLMGLILGSFWDILKPHESRQNCIGIVQEKALQPRPIGQKN